MYNYEIWALAQSDSQWFMLVLQIILIFFVIYRTTLQVFIKKTSPETEEEKLHFFLIEENKDWKNREIIVKNNEATEYVLPVAQWCTRKTIRAIRYCVILIVNCYSRTNIRFEYPAESRNGHERQ